MAKRPGPRARDTVARNGAAALNSAVAHTAAVRAATHITNRERCWANRMRKGILGFVSQAIREIATGAVLVDEPLHNLA